MAPTELLPNAQTQVSDRNALSVGLTGLRVLIVHDWLVAWAGAERCLEEMLRVLPGADLVVGVLRPELQFLNDVTRRARETWLGRIPGARFAHRWFVGLEGFAFASLDTRPYDLVVSSSHAFAKMVRKSAGVPHLCYCYSPPRYLWDLRETYRAQAGALGRLALGLGSGLFRRLDVWATRRVDRFLAISECVARRIHRCYGRAADVVYPPVRLKPGPGGSRARDGYLLYLGRLVPYKRIDLAILAAERMGIRLVIAGDGPERQRLEAMAGRYTAFLGHVSEQQAGELLSNCAAFVFCAEEDFGIAPVEANAHGSPVVCYAAGGVMETMIPGETAEFFVETTVDAVVGAVRRALEREWSNEALRRNAARFSPQRFRQSFQTAVEAALHQGRA